MGGAGTRWGHEARGHGGTKGVGGAGTIAALCIITQWQLAVQETAALCIVTLWQLAAQGTAALCIVAQWQLAVQGTENLCIVAQWQLAVQGTENLCINTRWQLAVQGTGALCSSSNPVPGLRPGLGLDLPADRGGWGGGGGSHFVSHDVPDGRCALRGVRRNAALGGGGAAEGRRGSTTHSGGVSGGIWHTPSGPAPLGTSERVRGVPNEIRMRGSCL